MNNKNFEQIHNCQYTVIANNYKAIVNELNATDMSLELKIRNVERDKQELSKLLQESMNYYFSIINNLDDMNNNNHNNFTTSDHV